jgi:predicted 2-oxoglutarate/Fe(II)-dependent dioxygenase YbiX
MYGYIKIPIENKDLMRARTEIAEGIGIETEARTTSQGENQRSVKMWRIPAGSFIWNFFEKITSVANSEFDYDITGIQDIQYLEYETGDYYVTHTDINDGDGGERKISMSWTLNDDYEGGELKIYHGGERVVINNKSNEIVAFTSFMDHSVSIVTNGTRKVLVCWIRGKRWR